MGPVPNVIARVRCLSPLLAVLIALGIAVPAQAAAVSINDNTVGTAASQFQYVGGSNWVYEQRGDTYQGDDHYDNHAGDVYQVSCSGIQAQIYTSKDAGLGIMGVSIDGGSETMVDLYSSSRLTQRCSDSATSKKSSSSTHPPHTATGHTSST